MSINASLPSLHDWSLLSLSYDWKTATATFHVRWDSVERQLVGLNATELSVPHSAPWGPSVSINTVEGPTLEETGDFTLKIQMQSGDVISLRAASIELRESDRLLP